MATTPKSDQQFAAHKAAITRLISEFQSPVIQYGQVFFLSTIRKRFLEILADEGVENPDVYGSYLLKRQLTKEWLDVAFIPQSGKSDLMCAATTTVGDALRKANDLAQVLRSG